MERNVIWMVLLLFFVTESTILPALLPSIGGVPLHTQLVLVGIILIGLLYHRYSALLYGVIFGLLFDMLYGQMIGVVAFAMGLTGYLVNILFFDKYETMFRNLLMLIVANLFYEMIVIVFYFLFGHSDIQISWKFMYSQVLPSLAFNLMFAMCIYAPAKKHFNKLAVRYH
jgi:rod shape-determining protein MreD